MPAPIGQHLDDANPAAPSGISGWLALLALGQVAGLAVLVVFLSRYFSNLDNQFYAKYLPSLYTYGLLNATIVIIGVCTTVLLFRHSRYFPHYFVAQILVMLLVEIATPLLMAFTFSRLTGDPILSWVTFETDWGVAVAAKMLGAIIWIAYVLRSRRVANTFVK